MEMYPVQVFIRLLFLHAFILNTVLSLVNVRFTIENVQAHAVFLFKK